MNQKTGNLESRECYLFWTYTIVSYRKIGENATQFSSLNSNLVILLKEKYSQQMDGVTYSVIPSG
jgi:hypothetical protein